MSLQVLEYGIETAFSTPSLAAMFSLHFDQNADFDIVFLKRDQS